MNTDASLKLAIAAVAGFAIGAGGLAVATKDFSRNSPADKSAPPTNEVAEIEAAEPLLSPELEKITRSLARRASEFERLNRILSERTAELEIIVATLREREASRPLERLDQTSSAIVKPLSGFEAAGPDIDKIQTALHATRGSPAGEAERETAAAVTVVLFDTGSATLTIGGQTRVMAAAQMLSESASAAVRIEAHTDTAGQTDHNAALAQARAEAVAAIFRDAGIPDRMIQIAAVGEEVAMLPVATPDGVSEPLNRQVAIFAAQQDL